MTRKELDDHLRMIQLLHEAKELQRITMAKAEESKADVKLSTALKEAMDDINQSVAKYEKQIAETYPDVVAFISTVTTPRVRHIMRLRYLYGLAWCEIPELVGHGVTEAGCKDACYTYLRAHCS